MCLALWMENVFVAIFCHDNLINYQVKVEDILDVDFFYANSGRFYEDKKEKMNLHFTHNF